MKTFIYNPTIPNKANAHKNGIPYKVQELPEGKRSGLPSFQAEDETDALLKFEAVTITPLLAPVKPLRTLTKRELVDKLIASGIASQFSALLDTLPLEEKLRWEASPTIAPDYPFIKEHRAFICSKLNITPEQLDALFR